MASLFDYLTWRGDISFSQVTVNPVDALIFSALSYISYGNMVEKEPLTPVTLKEAAEAFFALEDHEERVRVKSDLQLLHQAAVSRRFGTAKICMCRDELIPEQETQFAAMTFLLEDGTAFIAFRGTDYSLVGWKEDFNMSFQQTVPAQRLGVQYVREVAAEYALPLRIGGHSKGGNVAVFAAARSSPMVQERILEIYNNDGPGFTKYMMGDPGYLAMVPKIRTYVPQSSVIGMLLEHEEAYTVVKSKTISLLQHDFYSWEVQGPGFITVNEVTEDSLFLDATIKTWFAEMSNQERNQLVDVMFTLLGTGGVDNALEIFQPKNIRTYLKTISSDAGLRRLLSEEFQSLIEAAKKTRTRFEEERFALEEGTGEEQ